jgi:integrase
LLASIMRAAIHDGLRTTNPCTRVNMPAIPTKLIVPLSVEEVHALIEHTPEHYRAAMVTLAGAGLRQGELTGLGTGQVDFLRREIRVERQLVTPNTGEPYLSSPKRPASVRTIPVPELVVDTLAEHVRAYGTGPGGLLFACPDDLPMRRQTFARAVWTPAAAGAGIEETPHAMRHFYASMLIRAGLSVRVVQTLLGHTDPAETLRVYAHLWGDDRDRARAAVGESLNCLADFSRTSAAL